MPVNHLKSEGFDCYREIRPELNLLTVIQSIYILPYLFQ